MRQLFRRVILSFAALLVVSAVFAEVTFKVNAPLLVSEGEAFPVEFALNAKPDNESFTPPQFSGFNLIAGPTISTGTSIQIINGDMTRTVNYTYTYILIAPAAGTFAVSDASVVVDGKRYTTSSTDIEVVQEQNQSANNNSSMGGGRSQQQQRESSAANRIADDDLFMRMILSRESVYKGEPIHATIKLYSRVDIVNNSNLKMPTFNGFWAQDITDTRGVSSRETFNGKVYNTHVVREYLLYPQQAGELVIQPAEIDITAQIVVQSRNMDPFFGGGHEFFNVKRHLETSETPINVQPLPAGAPASFSGAVGKFDITIEPLESTTIKANSAATLRVRVSGSGNMTFVQAPKLDLPKSFEVYNVRTTESISSNSTGAVGYKDFEYPFIARSEGDYTIPSIEFSYFDSSTGAYNVVSTNSFSVNITPDEDGAGGDATVVQRRSSKMNIEMLGQDIHFIKLGDGGFVSKREPLILSGLYFVIMGSVLLIYTLLFVLLKRAMRDAKNMALRRGKRANKMAIQRFKIAKRYMDEGQERAFYEEMLRGLWGYMSDKLNIPVAELTKEYVREELSKRGCDVELIQSFADIITECDEAQYSPMSSSKMGDTYGGALHLVSKIESFVKRK